MGLTTRARLAPPILGAALALLQACGPSAGGTDASQQAAVQEPSFVAPQPKPHEREVAVLTVRGLGEIRIELLAGNAPETVRNFKKLTRSGFYDGTTFHRVIPEFMIQGGDPNTRDRDPRNDGKGGPGYTIQDEINDVSHVRGVVSMANKGLAGTAGSQFFIVVAPSHHLDGKYTAFGLVSQGLDVVDDIVAIPRDIYGRHGPRDRPLENVMIESIRIEGPVPTPPETRDEAS